MKIEDDKEAEQYIASDWEAFRRESPAVEIFEFHDGSKCNHMQTLSCMDSLTHRMMRMAFRSTYE